MYSIQNVKTIEIVKAQIFTVMKDIAGIQNVLEQTKKNKILLKISQIVQEKQLEQTKKKKIQMKFQILQQLMDYALMIQFAMLVLTVESLYLQVNGVCIVMSYVKMISFAQFVQKHVILDNAIMIMTVKELILTVHGMVNVNFLLDS